VCASLTLDREQETSADLTGLQLLQRAKIDPAGMITFFERLSEKDEGWMECGD
jgi:predicted Zn-dependent protease